MRRQAAAEAFKKNWFFLPGLTLICLGVTVVLFPQALAWVAAVFLVVSGITLIQAVRFVRVLTEAVRSRLSELVLEQGPDESGTGPFERRGDSIFWVN